MFYVIYSEDVADSLEKRQSVRPAHLARLQLPVMKADYRPLAPCPQ